MENIIKVLKSEKWLQRIFAERFVPSQRYPCQWYFDRKLLVGPHMILMALIFVLIAPMCSLVMWEVGFPSTMSSIFDFLWKS